MVVIQSVRYGEDQYIVGVVSHPDCKEPEEEIGRLWDQWRKDDPYPDSDEGFLRLLEREGWTTHRFDHVEVE